MPVCVTVVRADASIRADDERVVAEAVGAGRTTLAFLSNLVLRGLAKIVDPRVVRSRGRGTRPCIKGTRCIHSYAKTGLQDERCRHGVPAVAGGGRTTKDHVERDLQIRRK